MSRLVRGLALPAGFLLGACTLILTPDEDDDGVVRCDTTADCPELVDNRYVSVCALPDDDDADKVCVADYETIPCGSTAYPPSHPLTQVSLAAATNPGRYAECAAELLGSRGCGPGPDGCVEGLVLNPYGTCDDPSAEVYSVGAGQLELDDVVGRDVGDQFCRAYFCDERFVCSYRGTQPRCVPCEAERYFGRAGCGVLYLQGEPSSVYLDAKVGNCAGDLASADVPFGAI